MKLVDGGFKIDCAYTPASLYELAKMDGAIIMNRDANHVIYANAQLIPDATIPSAETGIRHRTAERMARQTGSLVIAISQRRGLITLYQGSNSYVLRDLPTILVMANQALQTLEKYRMVMDKELNRLSSLEFEEVVTLADVCRAITRCMLVVKVSQELDRYIIELGAEGRLVKMQMDEMMLNVREEGIFLIKDYQRGSERSPAEVFTLLARSFEEDVNDSVWVSRMLGYGSGSSVLEQTVAPHGYRLLQKLPRIPSAVIDNLVNTFGVFGHILQASINELDEVDGIGEVRARSIRNGLKRMQEQLMLEYTV
jgi:diadenylate cyclase